MAKNYSSFDAKKLLARSRNLMRALDIACRQSAVLKGMIRQAADTFLNTEVYKILQSLPVEEINKTLRTIRVKSLTDGGYVNMADLAHASIEELTDLQGISREGALAIKDLLRDFSDKIRQSTKLRLSVDRRTPATTQIVKAVYIYTHSLTYIKLCRSLSRHNPEVALLVDKLTPATGIFKRIFSSRTVKEEADAAYEHLLGLMNSDFYGATAEGALVALDQTASIGADVAWQDFAKNSIAYFTVLEETVPGLLGSEKAVGGLPLELANEIKGQQIITDGLKCTLRRYQEWGVKYILRQKRVLLGDEMGLGKTVQAIAAMVSLRGSGGTHFAVICPASVLTNWCREIVKHSNLAVIKVHGDDKQAALSAWLKSGGVAVTTYETAVHFVLEPAFKFSMLIVDEAHYIKNPEAKRTLETVEICTHADNILFMTGTALENNVEEMIRLMQILQPKVARQVKGMAFMASAEQFRDKIAPVYYRRKRDDVLTELPELTETREWCDLLPEEERVYEQAILNRQYAFARRVSWHINDISRSSKAARLKEIVDKAEKEGRKIIVFSFFLDTLHKVVTCLGDKCMPIINGSVSPQRRQQIVDEFESAPAGSVLVAQIQAGGTGLNIQSASVVIICEPQFKPSTENQAISRAYRMGQARNVLVYRLLSDDTIDEKITHLLEDKQNIFDAFADKSSLAEHSLELDATSVNELFRQEEQRIRLKRGIEDDPLPE